MSAATDGVDPAIGGPQAAPRFSVITPAFESRSTIGRAVASVLHNEAPLEIVIVDDGSRDPVRPEDLPPGPIRLIHRARNGGTAAARNTGIRVARGEWIAYLDSDDTYEPGRLDRAADVLGDGALDGLITDTTVIETDARRWISRPTPDRNGLMHLRTAVICSASIVRRSVFDAVGLFDRRWPTHEDADLWIRMLVAGTRIAYMPRPAYEYRLHDRAKTQREDPVVGLHEFRDIHLRNAVRPGVAARHRALLAARAARWEARAVPTHLRRAFGRRGS